MIYCYPKFSRFDLLYFRFLGPGLGNLLFPWARAVLASRNHGWRLLNPTWPQIKLGRLLRFDPDLRTYSRMFQPVEASLTGPGRLSALVRGRRILETESATAQEGDVVVFEGMKGLFGELTGDHEYLFQVLQESTRESCLPKVPSAFSREIVVHVRLGDFAQATASEIAAGRANARIPIGWYVEGVKTVREAVGANVRAHVFSDGKADELAELLALPACEMADFGSVVGDLVALSRGGALIASGSTFSMWASYFGQMPTVWHPGQLKQRLNRDQRFEVELLPGRDLPSASRELLATRLMPLPS